MIHATYHKHTCQIVRSAQSSRQLFKCRHVLLLCGVLTLLVGSWIGCNLLLALTSSCGFRAEWNALVLGPPRIPLPAHTAILSERDIGGRPSESGGGSGYRAYGELYHSPSTSPTVIAFYEQQGATCTRTDAQSDTWHCTLPTHIGWASVDIFAAGPNLALPNANRTLEYHLTQSVPITGTIIRGMAVWCDDV